MGKKKKLWGSERQSLCVTEYDFIVLMSSCLSASFCPLITNTWKICLRFFTCLSETLSNTCSVDVMDWTVIPLVLTDSKNIWSVSTSFNWFNFRTTPPKRLDFMASYHLIHPETFWLSNCLVFMKCYATVYINTVVFLKCSPQYFTLNSPFVFMTMLSFELLSMTQSTGGCLVISY